VTAEKKNNQLNNPKLNIMKTLFLKKIIPFGVIALGVVGAFVTTSMQSISKTDTAPKLGYLRNSNSIKCSQVVVNCSDTPSPFLCQLGGTSGPIAYDKILATNDCINPLYRLN